MGVFQFLIGTIQTLFKTLFRIVKHSFQFLIGTIQTSVMFLCEEEGGDFVSIPHRYDPNMEDVEKDMTVEEASFNSS